MAWTFGGVTIHVDDKGHRRSKTPLYAIQHVLDATSDDVSYYGSTSRRVTLDFALFEIDNGNTGYTTLDAAADANADVVLVSDQGAEGNYRILSLSGVRRQALNHANPVWDCVAELIKV